MTEEQLKELENDLKLCFKTQYHSECHNLLNILVLEEIPQLIEFTKKVNKAFKNIPENVQGTYQMGYIDAINQLKREIFD